MNLTNQNKSDIREHALQCAPHECCGVVIDTGEKLVVSPVKNIDSNPHKRFTLDPHGCLKALNSGNILAVYHSHAREESLNKFSEFDKQQSNLHNIIYILYLVYKDQFLVHYPSTVPQKYIGIEYQFGKQDCFTLVQDYYLGELNISIPNITHPYRFVENKISHPDNYKTYTILEDFFRENGFRFVDEAAKNDVILMSTFNIPSAVHCGIFVGDDLMLHHPFRKSSLIEPYSLKWQFKTKYILRHNSL